MAVHTYNIICNIIPVILGWTNIGAGPFFTYGELFGPGQGWFLDTPGVGALWRSTTINSTVNIPATGTIYDVTGSSDVGGSFPTIITQAALQALLDSGSTIVEGTQLININGLNSGTAWSVISGTDYPADYPFLPGATLANMVAASWVAKNITGGAAQIQYAYISFDVNVLDAPTLNITGDASLNIGDIDEDFIEMSPQLFIIGSGGIELNSGADEILSKDISGIYTLVANKTNDTLYNRTAGGSVTSQIVKIPDPFIKSGYIGS